MIKLAIILLSIFLAGCSPSIQEEVVAVNLPKNSIDIELYNLYEQKDYTLKRYEPENKCYLGMFVENTNGDFIKEFEEFTNTSPNVYIYRLKLGESYPLSWVLNCYSNLKMPFITILPPDDKDKLFDKELIKDMAKEFGNLNIPIFVNLYPVDEMLYEEKENYVKFFQDASSYFKNYAPNVSLVFSIDKDIAKDVEKIYVGDSYVDWVGLDIYEDIKEDNKLDIMFKELDFFYKKFSNKKPIFLNVGISHFGSTSYNYNIEDKLQEIDRYFIDIPNKYKRIKMINYQNYDTFNTNKTNKQNYLITDNKKILNKYTENANLDVFAKVVNFENNARQIQQEQKLDMLVYRINNQFFVQENFLNYLGVDKENIKEKIDIDQTTYYKLSSVIKNDSKIYVDEQNKKIIIS